MQHAGYENRRKRFILEQIAKDKPKFVCHNCEREFGSKQGLGGHSRHCKARDES